MALFLIVPFAQGIYLLFFKWNDITQATFAGVSNYSAIGTDPVLRASFWHVAVFVVFYAVIPAVLGLILTAIMGRAARLRGGVCPARCCSCRRVIASVVVATTWLAIYAPGGLANQILRAVGLGSLSKAWLGDFSTALPAVGIIGTWVEIGLCLVLFSAGVGQIPAERYEAARIDGAVR